jgi:hypothetical protein
VQLELPGEPRKLSESRTNLAEFSLYQVQVENRTVQIRADVDRRKTGQSEAARLDAMAADMSRSIFKDSEVSIVPDTVGGKPGRRVVITHRLSSRVGACGLAVGPGGVRSVQVSVSGPGKPPENDPIVERILKSVSFGAPSR